MGFPHQLWFLVCILTYNFEPENKKKEGFQNFMKNCEETMFRDLMNKKKIAIFGFFSGFQAQNIQ